MAETDARGSGQPLQPSPTRSRLATLPNELLQAIAWYLVPPPPGFSKDEPGQRGGLPASVRTSLLDARRGLWGLSLSSRRLSDVACRPLYSHVCLNADMDAYRLVRTLTAKLERQAVITSLAWIGNYSHNHQGPEEDPGADEDTIILRPPMDAHNPLRIEPELLGPDDYWASLRVDGPVGCLLLSKSNAESAFVVLLSLACNLERLSLLPGRRGRLGQVLDAPQIDLLALSLKRTKALTKLTTLVVDDPSGDQGLYHDLFQALHQSSLRMIAYLCHKPPLPGTADLRHVTDLVYDSSGDSMYRGDADMAGMAQYFPSLTRLVFRIGFTMDPRGFRPLSELWPSLKVARLTLAWFRRKAVHTFPDGLVPWSDVFGRLFPPRAKTASRLTSFIVDCTILVSHWRALEGMAKNQEEWTSSWLLGRLPSSLTQLTVVDDWRPAAGVHDWRAVASVHNEQLSRASLALKARLQEILSAGYIKKCVFVLPNPNQRGGQSDVEEGAPRGDASSMPAGRNFDVNTTGDAGSS